ncbi:MAG: PaaI family thioesterase, partial [Alphaproteobacteria bacterium]
MNRPARTIPEGFEAFGHGGPFADAIGPFFVRAKAEGGFHYAFYTGERHANANGIVHGGALFSFADHITGHAIVHGIKRMCATLKFKVEYLAPGPLDCLVEGEVEFVAVTRTLVFLRVRLFTGHRTLMTADGCCKLFAPFEPGQGAGAEPSPEAPGDERPPAPQGFQPFPDQGAFPALCGPVYYHRRSGGGFINGFHSRAVHDNTNGMVHGGVLFTFLAERYR